MRVHYRLTSAPAGGGRIAWLDATAFWVWVGFRVGFRVSFI
jgi:hypothetical protein